MGWGRGSLFGAKGLQPQAQSPIWIQVSHIAPCMCRFIAEQQNGETPLGRDLLQSLKMKWSSFDHKTRKTDSDSNPIAPSKVLACETYSRPGPAKKDKCRMKNFKFTAPVLGSNSVYSALCTCSLGLDNP